MLKEVANLNIKIILEHAKESGIGVEALLAGTNTKESDYKKSSKRVSWETYVKILNNLSKYASAEDVAKIGLMGAIHDDYKLVTRIIRGFFLRPYMLYFMQAKLTGKFLFKNISYKYEKVNSNTVRLEMNVKGTPPPQLFWDGYAEVYKHFPKLLGINVPAQVVMINNENTATFNISIYKTPSLISQLKTIAKLFIGFKGTVNLLGELQESEDEIRRAKLALEKKNEAIQTQLTIMSHDIFNSLQIINAYSYYAQRGKQKEKQKSFDISVQVIESILAQSRYLLSNGEFKPRNKVLLSKAVDLALLVLHKKIHDKNIEVHTDINECVVTFEKNLLGNSVIGNLLANAIKYTNSHGDIYIKGRSTGDFAILSIKDTGIGMSEECLMQANSKKKVTESELGTGKEHGSGLGLGIVKSIVWHYGGEISFESVRGKGTTVNIKLPLIMQLQASETQHAVDELNQ